MDDAQLKVEVVNNLFMLDKMTRVSISNSYLPPALGAKKSQEEIKGKKGKY